MHIHLPRLVWSAFALALALPAWAKINLIGITVNGTDVFSGKVGAGWTSAGPTLSLTGGGPFVISGSNMSADGKLIIDAVSICVSNDCTVVASNLTVDVSAFSGVTAFDCGTNAVALSLAGTNILASGQYQPGIHVPPGAALEITGAAVASLAVTGGLEAAGVGGKSCHYFPETKNGYANWGEDCGTVRIRGGILAVQGGAGTRRASAAATAAWAARPPPVARRFIRRTSWTGRNPRRKMRARSSGGSRSSEGAREPERQPLSHLAFSPAALPGTSGAKDGRRAKRRPRNGRTRFSRRGCDFFLLKRIDKIARFYADKCACLLAFSDLLNPQSDATWSLLPWHPPF